MTPPQRRIAIASAAVAWTAAVVGGMAFAMQAMATPDAAAENIAARWDAGLPLARVDGVPTLVVCLHPQCPCSAATLDAIEGLMPRYGQKLTVHVLFTVPADKPGWGDGELLSRARATPRFSVHLDAAGRLSERLGARTSGQAYLYDAAGALVFAGGLTPGRGESGHTAGAGRVSDLLIGRPTPGLLRTPVFGCALVRPKRPAAGPSTRPIASPLSASTFVPAEVLSSAVSSAEVAQ